MSTLAVLFPWARGDRDRDAAAEWVMAGWREHFPDAQLLHSGRAFPDEPWCKGRHLAWLLERTDADLVVVSDVDCWVPVPAIRLAVAAIQGDFPWAVPHARVRRLSREATAAFTASPAQDQEVLVDGADLVELPYPGFAGGGVVVAPAELARDVPIDPRFVGWGHEDSSWGMALTTLGGAPFRGSHDLVHLWHQPQPRRSRGRGVDVSVLLERRYALASGNPQAMADLIDWK